MVTRIVRPQPARRVSHGIRRGDAGSAVAAALVVALIVTVLAGSVVARSIGSLRAATAEHDRVAARTLAEQAVGLTVLRLDEIAVRHSGATAEQIAALGRIDLATGDFGTSGTHNDILVHVHIDADGSDVMATVIAMVGDATATASVRLRPRSTADLLWVTEFDVSDPMLRGLPRFACTWPNGDPRRHTGCVEIALPEGVLDGPVHSNDPLGGVLGTTFEAVVTSAAPHGAVRHRSEIALPRDIASVIGEAVPTCRFRGPTSIRFDGPRVRVMSPRSVPRPDGSEDVGQPIGCMGVDRAMLGEPTSIELPPEAIIEIVSDPVADCVLHPLGIDRSEDRERDWRCDAGDAFVWGRYQGSRTVLAEDSIQIVWDLEPGDASTSSVLGDGDRLGLVAGDSVVTRRPMLRDPVSFVEDVAAFAGPGIAPFGAYPLDAPTSEPTWWEQPLIVASVAALRGSFAPQNTGYGSTPALPTTVIGSLAGRFSPALRSPILNLRGRLVGWREFPIELRYDVRLSHRPPPVMPSIDGGRLRIVDLDVG